MNKILSTWLPAAMVALPALTGVDTMRAERIVIMHTNDTHSQIDPTAADRGGVARRKVLIDSIRAAEPHTLLLDAGDAVQGTVYFNLYGGEVESRVLNAMGYDFVTLGNHEFDNGVDSLATYIASVHAPFISTNYDLNDTPIGLLVSRYKIVHTGGKRIGLIALNVDPDGLIDPNNCRGVRWQDPFTAANATAWHLKHNERVDYVVALSHIGYQYELAPDDIDLASSSSDIDVVIGGHTHTLIQPLSDAGHQLNADGLPVLITQTGSSGENLGVVIIDTDTNSIYAEMIAVDSRLDDRVDPEFAAMLVPYRHGVDSLKSIVVGKSQINNGDRRSDEIINFVSAAEAWRGARLAPDRTIQLAIANRGGVRTGMSRGSVTRGQVMEMLPFNNHIEVLELQGSDLLEALEVNASLDRVSYDRPVSVVMDGDRIVSATIDGREVDPEAVYTIATIDYIAKGGDYMQPLTRGTVVAKSPAIMYDDIIEYIGSLPGKTIKADGSRRMSVKNR